MSAPITSERLAEIKRRLERISPGPWTSTDTEDGEWIVLLGEDADATINHLYFGDMETNTGRDLRNAHFIAHAREDVPALVAEVERLTNHNEALIQALVHIKLATEVRPVDDRWVSHISQLAEDALEDHA